MPTFVEQGMSSRHWGRPGKPGWKVIYVQNKASYTKSLRARASWGYAARRRRKKAPKIIPKSEIIFGVRKKKKGGK